MHPPIARAQPSRLIEDTPFPHSLTDAFDKIAKGKGGAVSSDFPTLQSADPDSFGVCVYLRNKAHGWTRHEYGDSNTATTAQSVSKIVNEAVARMLYGEQYDELIGSQESKAAYNEVDLDKRHRPANAMGNFGAIGVCLLIGHAARRAGTDAQAVILDRWRAIMEETPADAHLKNLHAADDAALLDANVYAEDLACIHAGGYAVHEQAYTGDAQASSNLRELWNRQQIEVTQATVRAAVDLFVKLCSLRVDARALAKLSFVLMNGGINPLSDRRIFKREVCTAVSRSMQMAGLYSESKAIAERIGAISAKSGISGALVAHRDGPQSFAFGAYGPRLSPYGNSIAALKALETFTHYQQRENS